MRAISTTSRRELSSSSPAPPPPATQGAEGNSPHSDRNISLFPSWSVQGRISTECFRVNSFVEVSPTAGEEGIYIYIYIYIYI